MAGEEDLIAKGAMVTRLDKSFRWPGGHRIAIFFNIAFEAWSDGKGPGIGPMGNPLPAGNFDTNALSFGNYGPLRGIPTQSRRSPWPGTRSLRMPMARRSFRSC